MSSDTPWATYVKAVIDFHPPGREPFRISPAPVGTRGCWPPGLTAPVHVITAYNPGSDRPGEETNRDRQQALERDLDAGGFEVWQAIGRDPHSAHQEPSFAVFGIAELEARSLAARYRQDAIFSWTPTALLVLSCTDARRHEAGWILEAFTVPSGEQAARLSSRGILEEGHAAATISGACPALGACKDTAHG